MDEKLKSLYDNLRRDGYELPDFDTFSTDMSDTVKAQRLYKTITTDGYEVPDNFDTFYSDINPPNTGGFQDYVGAVAGGFNRGVSKILTAPLKLIDAAGGYLQSAITGEEVIPNSGLAGKFGQFIEDKTNELNPRYENVNQLTQDVSEGVGQAVGLIGTLGIGGGASTGVQTAEALSTGVLPATGRAALEVGKRVATPAGVIGGSMTGVPEFEAAKAAGLSDEEAFAVLLKNYAVGQTEIIPLQNILGRLNRATGNVLINTLKNMGLGSLEEGIQEGIQTYLTNEIAKDSFDPDRDPMLQVLESAEVGGIVGLLIPGMVTLATRVPAEKRVKLERKIGEIQANAAIKESDSGDSQLNAIIDEAATLDPVDKQVLEEVKVAESLQEEQKEVEKQEKLALDVDDVSVKDNEQSEAIEPDAENKSPNTAETVEKELPPSQSPEYKEAVDKVTKLQEQFAALPIDQNADQLLFDLREARQSLQRIAGEAKTRKTPLQKTIENTTGITKQEPIVINNPAKALKEQIQTHYKLIEEGVRKGQKLTNETLIPKVQEAIKNFSLSDSQVNSILNRVRKTSLFTPGSINKLNTFIDRVTSDADYAENISQARSINKQLRRLSKSGSNISSIKSLAKAFAKINPEDTFIKEHLEKGTQLVNALTSPTKDNYSAINQEQVEAYIDDLNKKIEEYQNDELEKETSDPEEQLGRLRTIASFAKEDLGKKDLSDFDDSETIKVLKDLDVNRLDKQQLITAIRVIDNISVNDDFTGKGEIEAIARSQSILDKLKAKTKDKTLSEIKTFGKVNANIPQLFRRIYEDSKLASIIRGELGVQELFAAGSRVELKENQRIAEFKKIAKEFRKETGSSIRDYNNEALLGAFSAIVRKPKGGEVDLDKIKRNIERTAREYLRSEQLEAAEAWQKAYNTFQGINSVEEAFEVIPKPLLKVWEFFKTTFETDTNEQLRKVTEEQYDSKYVEEENYTHSGLTNLNDVSGQRDKLIDGEQQGKGRLKAKQSKTSLAATRNLPGGWAYNIDWIGSQFKALHESLYDIETAKIKMQLQQVLYSPEFEEIVGGVKNAKILRDQIFTGEQVQRGTTRVATNEAIKVVDNISRTARSVASARVLGSIIGQISKQVPPVFIKAGFNHAGTNSFTNFLQGLSTRITPNVERLFQNSQIGVRGERLGGIDRGNAEFYRLAAGGKEGLKSISRIVESTFDALDNTTRTSLAALTKFDTIAARKVWLGYYLQSLKEQGIGKVNLNEEYNFQQDPIRKAAVAFAEQQIAETQLPSNPAELSSIARNDRNQALNILKNIVLPFANYSLNAKQRLVQDVTSLYRNPIKKNFYTVAGDLAEITSFAFIQVYILGVYKDIIKQSIETLLGIEPPEKDEEKEDSKKSKQFFTTFFNGLMPTSIGTVGELVTDRVINSIAYLVENPDKNFSQWKKDTGGFVYENGEFDWGLLSLGFEAYTEAVSNTFDLAKSLAGEPIVVKNFVGNTKEIQLSEDQQRLLTLKTIIEWSSAVGLNEADIYNQIRKIYKEQLRKPNEKRTPRYRERIRN